MKSREKFCGISLLRIRKQKHNILGTNFMRAPENMEVDRYVLYHYRERRFPSISLHELNKGGIVWAYSSLEGVNFPHSIYLLQI
jgi:hypothetical protein